MRLGSITTLKNELKSAIQIALKSKSDCEILQFRVGQSQWSGVLVVDILLKDDTVLSGLLKKDEGTDLYSLVAPLSVAKNEVKK